MAIRLNKFRDLLEEILESSSFHVGGREFPPNEYRNLLMRDIQKKSEWQDSFRVETRIPDHQLGRLCNLIRTDLGEYVDKSTDRIGHAFPVGGGELGSHDTSTFLDDHGITYTSTSPVDTFAKSLASAAYALGPQPVSGLLAGWSQGEPVRYLVRSVLKTDGVLPGKYCPTAGVRIESLASSTDSLAGYLPLVGDLSPTSYLARIILTIEYSTEPALFRPSKDRNRGETRPTNVLAAGAGAACQALALESNFFVGIAYSWLDFEDVSSFQLSGGQFTLSHSGASRSPSWSNYSLRTDQRGVTTVEFRDPTEFQVNGERLAKSLSVLSDLSSQNIRIAGSRWLRSKDGSQTVDDRFIDLRIALESFYLRNLPNERSGEFSFRSALFGAWHLGATLEERRYIRKTLKDAYAKASQVVHTGEIDSPREKRRDQSASSRWRKNSKLLTEAQDFIRQGLLMEIANDQTSNWEDMVLGGGRVSESQSRDRPNKSP